ncbi:IQ domain-containing protein C-like isoform 1-T5 [Geothlypis trichas]
MVAVMEVAVVTVMRMMAVPMMAVTMVAETVVAVTMMAVTMMVAVTVVTMPVVLTVTLVTVTVLALPLDPLSDRSCTWPRARTPRTRGPDPGPVPVSATPGSPARARPGPGPRHGGGRRGPMTSAGGAGGMAAAPGPRAGAEAEGRRRLLRSVTRLQACARGFLLRRQLRSVREEFEAVVLEIEGDLRQLRWSGRVLQRPRFGTEDAPGPVPAGFVAPGAARTAQVIDSPPRPTCPEPCGAAQNPPDLGRGAAESPEEEEEGALEWDSDSSELETSPEIPEELQGLPRWELQALRTRLLLELLWVQQAIASRKHFLLLKHKLGVPDHPSSIPEFLARCGGALELQQQQP